MAFVGQLEPDALVCHFLAHPPEGFEANVVAGGMPSFVAAFDLLTTFDPRLRRRIRSLPLYRHWQRLLQPRTRFVGTTVSEYALVPEAGDTDVLVRTLTTTHASECAFLIVKDIPQDSPLLAPAANARAKAFAEALCRQGFVLLDGQALAWVPIDFADEDDYLARLSRGARRDIRRKLRARECLEVEALPCGDAAFLDPHTLEHFYSLYEAVFAQSDIHFDHLTAGFFRAVFQDDASGGVVFVYRHEGRLVGWNLCFEHAGLLVDKYVGFAYPWARALNLYVVSWMHNLVYARRRGLRAYVAGWTDPEVKAHLGACMTFTLHAVRPRHRLLRFALRHMAGRFERDRHWYQEHFNNASGGS